MSKTLTIVIENIDDETFKKNYDISRETCPPFMKQLVFQGYPDRVVVDFRLVVKVLEKQMAELLCLGVTMSMISHNEKKEQN